MEQILTIFHQNQIENFSTEIEEKLAIFSQNSIKKTFLTDFVFKSTTTGQSRTRINHF